LPLWESTLLPPESDLLKPICSHAFASEDHKRQLKWVPNLHGFKTNTIELLGAFPQLPCQIQVYNLLSCHLHYLTPVLKAAASSSLTAQEEMEMNLHSDGDLTGRDAWSVLGREMEFT
jgi:hypothetical protein